jgi:hypothetical protein
MCNVTIKTVIPKSKLSSRAKRGISVFACVASFSETGQEPSFSDKSLLCFSSAFSIGGYSALALSFVFQISVLKPAISTSLYP